MGLLFAPKPVYVSTSHNVYYVSNCVNHLQPEPVSPIKKTDCRVHIRATH